MEADYSSPIGPVRLRYPTKPKFYTYALGWEVQDYRGAKIVWHGGAVLGFQSRGRADAGKKCWLLDRNQQ